MKHLYLFYFLFTFTGIHAQFITNTGIELKNSANISTNGDWINNVGTNIINQGTIQTSESFVNNGTLDGVSRGGFTLDFATDLNFQPGGSQLGFLTKKGPGAALLTGTINIKDSLLLQNGILRVVNPNDTVFLGTNGLVTANAASYVEGLMAREGIGDFLFPLGKDGKYLPLKLYKVNAKRITTAVINAPSGYSAGPGLDSLINFPYAWQVQEKMIDDTAAYVEVNYPNDLPITANPIIAREVTGKRYASMGARFISNASGRVTIRGYTRGLIGLYTVAAGFPLDLETDSLALVGFYNATSGPNWTNKTNWLSGDIGTWFGVTQFGQSITALNLPSNNITGDVPDQLIDIQALETVNLSGNKISFIPDFTLNTEITSLNVSNNELNFASLEPNASIAGIEYVNQALLGTPLDLLLPVGSAQQFTVNAGGVSSEYVWKKNAIVVEGATSPTYTIPAINRSNMGEYVAEVTNPLLPGLMLKSAVQKALAYANVSGQLNIGQNIAATKGKMSLLKITPAAYDTIGPIEINNDGTFSFEKIILADYHLLGFADTLTHQEALPTYYTNTIFWEEADTIFLEDNVTGLAIVSSLKPAPTAGKGSIDGTLEEDDGSGGRYNKTQKIKRVGGAAVTARRVESGGRGKEEMLTLVSYVFTNDNGEFKLPDLPTGLYRLNIQYPGYPMDENSFITIPIGTALQSQVSVAASVLNGKINVKKIIITGVPEDEDYSLEVYPNPAVDIIRLKFASDGHQRMISILDLNGKTINATAAIDKDVQLNLHGLKKGMYFIRIEERGATVKTLKLSIE